MITYHDDLAVLCKAFNHACREITVTRQLLEYYIEEIEAVRDDL